VREACVDEQEPAAQQRSEEGVEAESFGQQMRAEGCQRDRGKRNERGEDAAVTVVEVVALFEGAAGARVKQAIGGVEDPHCDEHGDNGGRRKCNAAGPGYEPRPESSNRGCIERKQMPEGERGVGGDLFGGLRRFGRGGEDGGAFVSRLLAGVGLTSAPGPEGGV
jgi:hypothetical protein